MKSLSILAVVWLSLACSSSGQESFTQAPTPYLALLDEYIIPHGAEFDSTWIGGLSGIDNLGDAYAIISDDAARYDAPRFYKTQIDISEAQIDSIRFSEVVFFADENGESYQDIRSASAAYVDPEAVRIVNDTVYWGSEGFRNQRYFDPLLLSHTLGGVHLRTYPTQPKYSTKIPEVGPRHNASIEGLTLGAQGKTLWIGLEMPLYQDGAVPDANDGGAPIRISQIARWSGEEVFEFAYQLEPIFVVPDSGAFAMNGAVELLWLAEGSMLVLERSYVAGVGNKVRLFRADYAEATDTRAITSLKDVAVQVAKKTLLLDFDDLPVDKVDNIEGFCWGPDLDNGRRTLIFVADNNFSDSQINQVILVEVMKPLTD